VKLLVVTSEPISSAQLRAAVGDGAAGGRGAGHGEAGDRSASQGVAGERTEVMVVAPALQESAFRFWLSDADEAIQRAEEVRRRTVENLDQSGMAASGDTGESDPLDAIQDALATFPADRIVLFTHPGSERRYREDIDPVEVEERFGLPVEKATVER
jgi:hypothetical protein